MAILRVQRIVQLLYIIKYVPKYGCVLRVLYLTYTCYEEGLVNSFVDPIVRILLCTFEGTYDCT